jgi:Flp pilus assembly protein TadD
LAEAVRAHERWEKIAWRELARVSADYQDYRPAYEKLRQHAGAALPDNSPNDTAESLAARFRATGDETDGLLLARAQAANGDIDDALAVVALLSARPHASPLVHQVEAELWARKEDWAKAWQALWRYVEKAKPAQ